MKRILSLLIAMVMTLGCVGITAMAEGSNVAKVGNTEYATIDEAIAAWTNGTTLTLLADVTLSDVITIKSTEHHILNLGTYTMTAASNKNAFVIQACGNGSAERSTITINADATNPGGINAGTKCVVYYKYADGGISTEDRPIIKINGGIFTGSTSSFGTAGIYTIGTAARKCATLNISGGTFNCSINGSGKSKLIISGGTFNYSVGSQGDSTANRLISGGTFKTFGFMTADSNNTKFWFGTSMNNSNVGVYVDDNGYIVVGGDPIIEAGETFEASSANYSGASSLLQYSSAKNNGLYYTSVEEAFADNNKTTGSVTVYVEELDMTDINYKGTIVVPEGKEIKIIVEKDTTPTWSVTNDASVTYTDADGNVLEKDESGAFVESAPAEKTVATVDGVSYTDIQEAIKAAAPDRTVELLADVTVDTWYMMTEKTIASNQLITLVIDGLVIKGNDNTLTINSVESASNGGYLFDDARNLSIQDLTIEYPNNGGGIGLKSGTISNVTINGGNGIYPGANGVTISGCTFKTNGDAIYYENENEGIVITGNTFEIPSTENVVILRSNEQFTDNTIVSGRTVNIAQTSSATVRGNDFGNVRFKVYNEATATIENNTINNLVFDNETPTQSTFTANMLSADAQAALDAVTAKAVAKIGTTEYTDFAAAMTDANAMAGDVTVEIYDKVTLNTSLAGNYDSIKFVGMTDNAEIYMEIDGYIEASSKNVSFADLKLSKSAGPFVNNAGFMNVAFGVYSANTVTYTNCTFANGAYASSGTNTFTGCTFYRSHDKYGLWAYGNVDVVVEGCTFADYRGIKMYAEGAAKTVDLTVTNTNFSAVTDKPAIVLTYGENVTLEKNTYSSTGVFELDLDGAPNGTPVTSDVAPTCKNDNGVCGVLVDGKIYTTVAQAAEVATEGSKVTLLHNSTETVEFAEGVILDKNGFEAAGVTVKVSAVAEVNGVQYATLEEAFAAAKSGDEILLLADVEGDITIPANVIFNGNGFAVSGGIIADGNITFAGITKAKDFDVKYIGTTINIGSGATLELTGTDRMVIGHDCTFNITGTITDAKTANVADLAPSLIVAAGASFTGTNLTFNVTNAYIKFNSNSTSKNKNANGTFNFNITNSIWEQTGVLGFYVPTEGMDPTFNLALKDSVLTSTSHLVFSVSKGEIVIDNSNVNVGKSNQIENQSTMTIKNGSVVNGAVATSSDAKNPGTIIVEDATYAVTGQFSGSDLGTGTLIIKKGANVSVGSIVDKANIVIDATGMTAGETINFNANLSKFAGTVEVINNDALEAKIVDGKVVLVTKPVAYIGEQGYETVQAAINAAQDGDIVTISAGEYGAINISNKNITIQGTVGDDGELLTTIKGGNPAITGHSFNGTIKNIRIVNAFKVMYAEPAGNVTVDNVYVTGATYGLHLVAYSTGLTWKIENSYMDLAWANSFGVSGNGYADIIIRGNTFAATNPYYAGGDVLSVNSFLPSVTVEENIFGENSKIYINATDTSKINISKNYHADGVENAFADRDGGVTVPINQYYTGVDENGKLTGLVELPKGSNSPAYTGEADGYVRVWGEGGGNAKESFVLKLYSEETLMATTTLNNVGGIIDGNVYVTWTFFYPKSNDAYWTTTWEAGHPNKLAKPTKVELYIDGTLISTTAVQMNGADGVNPVVWEDLGGVQAPELPIAKIGDTTYTDFAEALADAKEGDTINLIWEEGDAPIAMNGSVFGKSVTITGDATVDWSKGFLFVGRGGEGNGTVIFDNANLASASNSGAYGIHVSGREKDTNNKYDGTLTIKDSAIELDYLINRGVINVDNSTLTVKNGFGIAGRPASETESGEAATATINIANESYVKVLNHNGMGVGVASATSEGNGVLNLTDSTFECASFNIDAKLGDFNVYGESTLNIGTLTGKEIDLHHDAIIKDSVVGGEVMLYGKVTFRGDNTFSMLSDYGNAYSTEYAEWIVEKGASVTLTEKARYGLGYGDKVTIYGNLEDALTARETLPEDDISLFTHGLVAMSNWNVANSLTVKDAYVVIGSNNSFGNSPNDAHVGTYDIDFENAVLDASRITFYAAKSKTDFSFKNSDVKVGTFMTRDTDSVFTLNNTKLVSTTTTNGTDEGNYHAGTLNLENSSITYSAPLVMENGTLTLGENSSLTAPTITGTGKIVIDATGMTAGEATNISGNASGFTGTIEVINNDSLEASIDENGNIVLTEAPEVKKFKLALTNATLGNSLAINFFYAKSDIVGTEYVAKIKHNTATGVEEKEIPYTDWVENGDYIYVPYDGISAKQMGDRVEITICKKDDTAVSETEFESLENYAINYFDFYKNDSSMALWKKAIADMLNYGAAAQTYFGYNADKLVNVTAANDVAEYASTEVKYAGEYKSGGEGAYATSLNLKDKIELIALFTGVTDDMTAKVEFTNHKKETISYEAELKKNGPYHEVIVDKLVIADINQPVKVTVYNKDGSVYAWIQDSINEYLGYIQNTNEADPLFEMASKFATSAYAAMHAKD